MRPLQRLLQNLDQLASAEHCLFTPRDLKILLPDLSNAAFKTLLSRAAKANYLTQLCRGLYLYKKTFINDGRVLFYAAAKLRADEFNYQSRFCLKKSQQTDFRCSAVDEKRGKFKKIC